MVTGSAPLGVCWLCPGGYDIVEKDPILGAIFFLFCVCFLFVCFVRKGDLDGMMWKDSGGGGGGGGGGGEGG